MAAAQRGTHTSKCASCSRCSRGAAAMALATSGVDSCTKVLTDHVILRTGVIRIVEGSASAGAAGGWTCNEGPGHCPAWGDGRVQ